MWEAERRTGWFGACCQVFALNYQERVLYKNFVLYVALMCGECHLRHTWSAQNRRMCLTLRYLTYFMRLVSNL